MVASRHLSDILDVQNLIQTCKEHTQRGAKTAMAFELLLKLKRSLQHLCVTGLSGGNKKDLFDTEPFLRGIVQNIAGRVKRKNSPVVASGGGGEKWEQTMPGFCVYTNKDIDHRSQWGTVISHVFWPSYCHTSVGGHAINLCNNPPICAMTCVNRNE